MAPEIPTNNQKLRTRKLGFYLLAALALLSACASPGPAERITFPNATINAQPVHLFLDTGSSTALMDTAAAKRLKIKSATAAETTFSWLDRTLSVAFSDPVQLTPATTTLTVALPVADFSGASFFSDIDFDALIGWPEIRDNILVFDTSTRTVRRVEELPPETAGWLKLKIRPGNNLLLETPLPDGHTGLIAIDTGQPSGALLPAARWKAWNEDNPDVSSERHAFGIPYVLVVSYGHTLANKLTLGPLTLTDVPVGEMDWADNSPDLLANLGVVALERMDLVTDGKNGFAYLHPKSSAAESKQGHNWTVAPDVHVSPNNVLAFAASSHASVKDAQGDHAGALADFSRALELDPTNANIYDTRAVIRKNQEDFAGAVADYDKYIELRPEDSNYQRLYRQLLRLRLGQSPADFTQTISGWKDSWVKTIGQFLLGQVDETAFLAAAEKKDEEPVIGQQCEAFYYIGEMRLLHGDSPGARDFFKKSIATGQKDYYEFGFARDELARLDPDAKK